ncbi:HIT family protein [Parvularcula marina]|uniref:HIT family protein n=1 Tax=Parvularcula marina TaxID=2292771 RepID=UPI00351734F5
MSLDEKYDSGNVFAKIISGDIPSAKIFEDDDVLAFMDAFPQSRGHALIISKTSQAVNLLDAEEDVLSKLIKTTQAVARAATKALSPDGVRIVQFNGAPAGQSVFHLHFHVIPVYEGTPLGAHGGGMGDMTDLQVLAGDIRNAL